MRYLLDWVLRGDSSRNPTMEFYRLCTAYRFYSELVSVQSSSRLSAFALPNWGSHNPLTDEWRTRSTMGRLRAQTTTWAPFERVREASVAAQVPAIMLINEHQLHVAGERDARVCVLEEWLDAGLELGNHTFSHKRLHDTKLSEYLDEIIKGETVTRPLLALRQQELVWRKR